MKAANAYRAPKAVQVLLLSLVIQVTFPWTFPFGERGSGAVYAQQCPAPPVPDDMNWRGIQASADGPIPDGASVSVMTPNGDVYIAGYAGSGIRVARWDGAQWTVLGDRIYHEDSFPSINALDVAANGDVYLGGVFTHASNAVGTAPVDALNIARWDASRDEWVAVGEGVGDAAYSLTVDDNANVVYVGSQYGFNPGGQIVTLNYVGRWNIAQAQWEPVGAGVGGKVHAMAIDGAGDVYVAGEFDEAYDPGGSAVAVHHVARWDGTQWHALGQGLTSTSGTPQVRHLDVDGNGRLYLGGTANDFSSAVNADGTTVDGPVVRWDGTAWTRLPRPAVGAVFALIVDGTDMPFLLYMDETYTYRSVEYWDGNQWVPIARLESGFNYAYTLAASKAISGRRLYMGGPYEEFTDPANASPYALRKNAIWNGQTWQGMTGQGGTSGSIYVLESNRGYGRAGDVLYVGGDFSEIANVPVTNMAAYDGRTWAGLGGGLNGPVHALDYEEYLPLWTAPLLVAGGEFTEATNPDGSVVTVNHVARWNGNAWSALGGGVDGPVRAVLSDVIYFNLDLRGRIIVGGDFSTAFNPNGDPVEVQSVALWNVETEQWEPLGEGLTGAAEQVLAIAKGGPPYFGYYLGGSFTAGVNPDGSSVDSRNLIYWNGLDRWLPVGEGVNDAVRALTFVYGAGGDQNHILYAGGDFTESIQTGGTAIPTPYLSVWHPSSEQWLPVAGGLDGPVHTIAPLSFSDPLRPRVGTRVVIGGEFTAGRYPNGNSRFLNHVGLASLTEAPTWFPLGFNAANDVVRTAVDVGWCGYASAGQNIFIGGDFTAVGVPHVLNAAASKLARWHYRYSPCFQVVKASTGGSGGGSGSVGVATAPGFSCSPLTAGKAPADDLLVDDLGFRDSGLLDSIPVHQYFDLTLFPSGDPDQPIAVFDSLLINGDNPGSVILIGVDDTTRYAPNPEGRSIATNVLIHNFDYGNVQQGNVELRLVHAVTDAPAVDVALQGGAPLVQDLHYGESRRVSLAPGTYTFDILDGEEGRGIGSYTMDLATYEGQFAVLVLSGFLDPASNQDGPAVSLDVFATGVETMPVAIVEQADAEIPERFELLQNYPNPFNPTTQIELRLSQPGFVNLTVYDVLGREVATLIDEEKTAGSYRVTFDGSHLASGVYFYRLTAPGYRHVKKMILLK